jgi:hypothetical protein
MGCQADYDDTRSNSDERRQRQKYLTILKYFFYRLDQENMLEEIVAGYGSDYLIER